MPENIMMIEEDRNFIEKAKEKVARLREQYKENYIDTGKSQEWERKIDEKSKKQKRTIKILGTAATIALMFCPADGPFGEICTALATPGLCALVDISAEIRKKMIITGKRTVEKKFLKVDGSNENVAAYDLTNGEIINDFKELLKNTNEISRSL